MRKNSYLNSLNEVQILAYIIRSILEGKNIDQIIERFDGDSKLVNTWIEALQQIHFITKNSFDELVITSDGENFLQAFDLHR
jgi:CMP-N-acetylneuraminic acid synthetase